MRPQTADFTPEEMSGWYLSGDLLGEPDEHRLQHPMTIDAAADYLLNLTRWGA